MDSWFLTNNSTELQDEGNCTGAIAPLPKDPDVFSDKIE
jgi:hypothetical protein